MKTEKMYMFVVVCISVSLVVGIIEACIYGIPFIGGAIAISAMLVMSYLMFMD